MTTVDNSAAVVALLCLPEASWIAGQTITVDGGYRLWGGVSTSPRGRSPRADLKPDLAAQTSLAERG